MRTGSAFRMVLDGESRFVFQSDPFDRFVVQIHVCHFYVWRALYRFGINAKAMILRSDFTLPCDDIFNRMIQASMSMMHLERRYAVRESQQLVSKANAECGFLFIQQILYRIDRVIHSCRVTRTIGDEIAVWIELL